MTHPTDQSHRPLFSIFIPTWNNLPFLKLCVESIEKNSAFPHEILIHVNDGSDGTLEWVKERGFKHTHSAGNIGVCWAMNRLRPLMTTDYVMYVNDDMYMCPGWDSTLYKEACGMPDNLWFLGSTILQPQALRRRPNSIVACDFGRTPDTFREPELLSHAASLNLPDWRGAMLPPTLVHRDMWDLVGGYSIEYFPGMASDPDFNAKLWLAGVRVFKGLGHSLCYHFMSVSVNRIVKNDGPIQFLRKYGITVRAFEQQLLRHGELWDTPTAPDPGQLRSELMRSSAKKLLTALRNVKTTLLWDDIKSQGKK